MGFELLRSQPLPDIQSVGHIYQHQETGAQVIHIENGDLNRAFIIAFKTPPYSDNGITHIIEHSVLNGSAKFPSKEPFVELLKGSMNTFLNAMTFSDKTIYPVASTNDKDFDNLMQVYLDAVFAPNFRQDPQILAQEGWHYHLEDLGDPVTYKGVVYNEMKGAMASADAQLEHYINKNLYPGTLYAQESGGLPQAIPQLTQKEFVDYHARHYHPSNSLTILYGKVDRDLAFGRLAEYFDGAGQGAMDEFPVHFEGKESVKIRESYSLSAEDDGEDKDYLALAWHVADADELFEQTALSVLTEILLGNNQAPLKRALLDADLAGDITGGEEQTGAPTLFKIVAKYSEGDRFGEFLQVVESTLSKLATEGIDPELIDASLRKISFGLKETVLSETHPRGVMYAISVLDTWLYGQDPFYHLGFSEELARLAELSKEGYFERLIQEKLIDNPYKLELILKGEAGKSAQEEEQLVEKLAAYRSSLTGDQLKVLVDETQALLDRQNREDKPEDLAKIPTLSKEDLDSREESIQLDIETGVIPFFHAPQFTSGIDYLYYYLDVKDLAQDQYPYLSLLTKIMGKLATENYSSEQLQRQIDLHTGGVCPALRIFADAKEQVKPYFVICGKALETSLDQHLFLMKEILTHTIFDNSEEIQKIINKELSRFESQIDYSAHSIAVNRAMSQLKVSAKLTEQTAGIDYYYFLKDCKKTMVEDHGQALIAALKSLVDWLTNAERVQVLYIGGAERKDLVKDQVVASLADMKRVELAEPVDYQVGTKQNEAYVTAQDVNYVSMSADGRDKLAYSGSTTVMSGIIGLDHLWNEIRVKGGAYGAFSRYNRNGDFMMATYRDPNIRRSLDVFKAVPNMIAGLELSDSELLKRQIGQLSPIERPLSAQDKGKKAFYMYQAGLSHEDIQQLKEEIIATDLSKIKDLAPTVEKMLEDATVVVVGNKEAIEKDGDLFDKVYDLY